jgi:hypothetical protein
MKNIQFNLKNEIERLCLDQLVKAQFKIPNNNSLPLICLLLNIKRKLIEQRPRLVHLPNKFNVPIKDINGMQILINKMSRGVDINPYQSTHLHRINFHDGLLNDFGLYHFHLGEGNYKTGKNKRYIKRTGHILIAKVDENDIYVVGVFKHGKEEADLIFTDSQLLELLYDNWPHVLEKYMLKNVTGHSLSPLERYNLRSNGANACISLKDGTVIMSPGGGMMANQLSSDVYMEYIHLQRNLDELKTCLFESVYDRLPDNISFKMISFGHNELSLFSEGNCYFIKIQRFDDGMKVSCFYPGYGPLYSHGFINKPLSKLSESIMCETAGFAKINFLCPFPTIIIGNKKQ